MIIIKNSTVAFSLTVDIFTFRLPNQRSWNVKLEIEIRLNMFEIKHEEIVVYSYEQAKKSSFGIQCNERN